MDGGALEFGWQVNRLTLVGESRHAHGQRQNEHHQSVHRRSITIQAADGARWLRRRLLVFLPRRADAAHFYSRHLSDGCIDLAPGTMEQMPLRKWANRRKTMTKHLCRQSIAGRASSNEKLG